MSKSPKALLPSSLSLASLSRALPGTQTAASSHAAARSGIAVTTRQAQRDAGRHTGVVVRHRRPASSLAQSTRRASSAATSGSGSTHGYTDSGAGNSSGGALLRRARTTASTPSTVSAAGHGSAAGPHFHPRASPLLDTGYSSYAVAGPSRPSRYFHSAACERHQQSVSPASGGIVAPPPGSGGPPSSGGSAAVDGGAFQPKHHSSVPLSSHDGPLLPGSVAPGSGSGQSPPTGVVDPSSSSSPASSSQSQSTHATSTSIPATLFSHPPPASVPNHALPAFFGSALNIARRSNLVFRNGAYGIPKTDYHRARSSVKGKEKAIAPVDEAEHYLSVGVGEDSYFLRPDSLGVADGVGGWSGHAGANSARWARKFMHHCSAELARYENVDDEMFLRYYDVDPVEVMQRAYEKTLSECKEEGTIGSSTALLAVLRNDELRLANLGDCSCCVIRGDEYIFRTEEQQHRFNYPFQAGTNAKDTPAKDAQKFAIKVRKDDIVILSSDGLVDNVFSDDMLEEVLRFVGSAASAPPSPSQTPVPGSGPAKPRFTLRRFSPQAVSEALCHRAKSVYEDQRAVASPFQQRAMEEGIHYAGGKIDDISCLVGVVGELEASPNRRDVT